MPHPIEKKIPTLPARPGVYIMKAASGTVLYVGKAKNLKARLRSYVGAQAEDQLKVRFLVPKVKDLDTIVTQTEKEALLLENTLIKKYRPRYNIRLVDDKSYLSILLDRNHPFPRFVPVRRPGTPRPGQQVFGPYSSAHSVRDTLRQIHKLYPLRTCKDREFKLRKRPCLQHQMGRCTGACTGEVSPEAYSELVDQAVLILQGRNEELVRRQEKKMKEASDAMRYEEAARIRDRIAAIRLTMERQGVVESREADRDVIGMHREGKLTEIVLLKMRGGNLQERRGFPLANVVVPTGELLRSFLLQAYSDTGLTPPAEILLFDEPEDRDTLEEVLAEIRGRSCSLKVPLRGDKKKLVDLAVLNARVLLEEHTTEDRARQTALAEIGTKTGMLGAPDRIECFDISDLHGTFAVGSCVVFEQGVPCKSDYRRYRIRVSEGADDYGKMYEVLSRRFREDTGQERFPDLLLVDGGKGHLNVARRVLEERGVHGVRIAAIAKGRERWRPGAEPVPAGEGEGGAPAEEKVEGTPPEAGDGEMKSSATEKETEKPLDRIFLPGRSNPLNFSRSSGGLRLLQQVRDEAHRFAVAYHRKLRSRELEKSELDAVPGIGRKRKKALLTALGDVEKIRRASVEELARVPGMDEKTARQVLYHLRREKPGPSVPTDREVADPETDSK